MIKTILNIQYISILSNHTSSGLRSGKAIWERKNMARQGYTPMGTKLIQLSMVKTIMCQFFKNLFKFRVKLIGQPKLLHIAIIIWLFITVSLPYTGLDPARPGFRLYLGTSDCHLDRTDADFVDVIHTDGPVHLFGLYEPVSFCLARKNSLKRRCVRLKLEPLIKK